MTAYEILQRKGGLPEDTYNRISRIGEIAPRLAVRSEFVPWSRSRNAGEKSPSLNWRVTLYLVGSRRHKCECGHEWVDLVKLSAGTANVSGEATPWCDKCQKRAASSSPVTGERDILTTDYMQGIGHVPGYSQKFAKTVDGDGYLNRVAETGKTSRLKPGDTYFNSSYPSQWHVKPLAPPALDDVLYSLLSDASAIDAGDFESWAAESGYDTDSREAERIYRACVEIGLKLRAALGDERVTQLREALQDM